MRVCGVNLAYLKIYALVALAQKINRENSRPVSLYESQPLLINENENLRDLYREEREDERGKISSDKQTNEL